MWNYGDHMGWGWMGIWWIVGLVILAAVLWSLLTASRRGRGPPHEDTPEQVLKRRYAKGEIDGETYRRMLQELRA